MADHEKLSDRILDRSNLQAAWEQVRANKAAPGLDGVSLGRWERSLEANLARLRDQALANTYTPNRPKRFQVAKKGGGLRELSRLTVADKVLQRAVLNIIEPFFERRFLGCSHGYRPRRSVATAVRQVLAHRDLGRRAVLDADISACFDSLDHAILIGEIRRVIDDGFTLNLMQLWLKAGRRHRHRAVGVPMGAVLSPLWCNIYLHPLDAALTAEGWKPVRYADDFVILTETDEQAQLAREMVAAALDVLKLSLNPKKTRTASFDEGFTFLGVRFEGESFSYSYRNTRIEVSGRGLSTLYRHPPDFYAR